jgi:hypothetical protein
VGDIKNIENVTLLGVRLVARDSTVPRPLFEGQVTSIFFNACIYIYIYIYIRVYI